MDDLQWLGTRAAATYLGVTPRTLYRMIDQGLLPAYQMGRVIRVQQADVQAYLRQARIEPGSLGHLYPDSSSGVNQHVEKEEEQ